MSDGASPEEPQSTGSADLQLDGRVSAPRAGDLQKWIVANLATISVASFIIVAVKVFRVSDMETSTAVAVITSADTSTVIRGVLIALLPAFLGALISAFSWWMYRRSTHDADLPRLPAWVAWILFAIALFIVPTVGFLLMLGTFLVALGAVRFTSLRTGAAEPGHFQRRRLALFIVGTISGLAAVYFVGKFVLDRGQVWVPEERVTFAHETRTGFVLNESGGWTAMLTEESAGGVRKFERIRDVPLKREICLASPPSTVWYARRPIQLAGQLAGHIPLVGRLRILVQGASARTPYGSCFGPGPSP